MKNLFKKIVVSIIMLESKMVLKKHKPKVVAVTGTVGKSSTKDAIYTALSRTLSVRKTKKSQNSEIGIPLTILGCANPISMSVQGWLNVMFEGLKLVLMPNHYPEWLILEIGADHPGDIESTMKWIRPDVAVVTRLSKVPVHVEFFPSVEQVVREKSFIVRALKRGGTAVLNADDEDVAVFKDLTKERVLFFGSSEQADLSMSNYEVMYDEEERPTGIKFEVLHRMLEDRFPVILRGTIGQHLVYPILAALTVAEAVGENAHSAAKSFHTHEPTPGRMRIIEGKHGSTIIDDTYNSSPVAVFEALHTLKFLQTTGRRIAVLGDMLELGRYSIEEHKKAGIIAAESANILVTIGQRSEYTAEAARLAGLEQVHEFDDSKKAGAFLKDTIEKSDIVLVKGSQGVRTERVVEELMEHPEDKEKLLVRQDAEWRARDKKHS